jgi:hypothetical protein
MPLTHWKTPTYNPLRLFKKIRATLRPGFLKRYLSFVVFSDRNRLLLLFDRCFEKTKEKNPAAIYPSFLGLERQKSLFFSIEKNFPGQPKRTLMDL